jgi:hypothetical protein
MAEHLRLAGAEMDARDLIVLWGLFLQRPATPIGNDASCVNASRLPISVAN